jgi:hypothetical protein
MGKMVGIAAAKKKYTVQQEMRLQMFDCENGDYHKSSIEGNFRTKSFCFRPGSRRRDG